LRIAVLGGGNGSFAAAADFALQGHDVRLWRRDARMVAEHRARDFHVAMKDSDGRHDVQLALVTNDIGEAVRGAELILCLRRRLPKTRSRICSRHILGKVR